MHHGTMPTIAPTAHPLGKMNAVTRVLVVDDEEHIAELVGVALRFSGFDVTTALTGRDALAEVRRSRPDLVVLDVMLGDLDGFEVARRIREPTGQPAACR